MHNVHCDPAIALIRRHPDGIRFEVEVRMQAGMTTSIYLALIGLSEGRYYKTRDRYPSGATNCCVLTLSITLLMLIIDLTIIFIIIMNSIIFLFSNYII